MGIENRDIRLIEMLYEQRDYVNRLFIPELILEGLVSDTNSPYQSVKALNNLSKNRIILYEVLEVDQDIMNTPIVYDPRDIPAPKQMDVVYKRVALLNLEYPVMFFCAAEDDEYGPPEGDTSAMEECYEAIKDDTLAEYLTECKAYSRLEFLNYTQSIFQQPLTLVEKKDGKKKIGDNPFNISGGRRLAVGANTKRDWGQIQQGQVNSVQVEKDPRVAAGSRWQVQSQEEIKGADAKKGRTDTD